MHTIIGYCYKWSAPCQQNLSFTRSILAYLRKTLHESSKIFFENVWHVARIYFYTQAYMIVIPMHYSDHSYTEDHQFINNRCSQLKKNQGFSSLEVQTVLTSKAVSLWDLCKLPFHLLTQENVRRLCSQTNASLWRVRRNKDILYYTGWVICCLFIVIFQQFLETILLK